MKYLSYILLTFPVFYISCTGNSEKGVSDLPILGRYQVVDSASGTDTVFHKIADFRFVDQDSNWVTNETFSDQIYVADFFFTTCPDICPKMKAQMLRVYDHFEDEPGVKFLSHTIDPKHDSVAVLKDFAERIGVETDRWHFVTGEKSDIYKLGQTSYMASMADQGSAGFSHSGRFFLVDKQRHIRGAYDGTDPTEVDILIKDIHRLLKSYGEVQSAGTEE